MQTTIYVFHLQYMLIQKMHTQKLRRKVGKKKNLGINFRKIRIITKNKNKVLKIGGVYLILLSMTVRYSLTLLPYLAVDNKMSEHKKNK